MSEDAQEDSQRRWRILLCVAIGMLLADGLVGMLVCLVTTCMTTQCQEPVVLVVAWLVEAAGFFAAIRQRNGVGWMCAGLMIALMLIGTAMQMSALKSVGTIPPAHTIGDAGAPMVFCALSFMCVSAKTARMVQLRTMIMIGTIALSVVFGLLHLLPAFVVHAPGDAVMERLLQGQYGFAEIATAAGLYAWLRLRMAQDRSQFGVLAAAASLSASSQAGPRAGSPALRTITADRDARCVALVESSRGFIAISDSDGGAITYINPAGRRLIGLSSEGALGTLAVQDVMGAEEWQRICDSVLPVLQTRGAWQGEMRLLHQETGESIEVIASNFQVIDQVTGRPVDIAWVMTDMRAQQHQQAELRRAKDVAEAEARAKSEFLATMSHEIRTPMNGVIGMAGLLLDTPLSEQQRSMIDTLRSSADSLLTILNDILDFSKIEAGRMELEVIDFDLRQVVEDAVALLAENAHAKGLEVACSIAADVPVAVRGDPGRLRQVLVNLVSNAVKFTEKGEVVVRVTLKSDASTGLHRAIRGILPASGLEPDLMPVTLEIEVEDTGIGIPFASQPRLFRPFSQADSSTTRRFGGTGLGLAICKRLVELMGGGISLASAPGLGSTFRFTVSLVPRTARPLPVSPLLAGLRVLVTDDNATYRRILAAHVGGWGMVCTVCEDAATALQRLAEGVQTRQPYRIAIIDMRMPGMDGLHAAAAIRARTEHTGTAIILLTTLDTLALGRMSLDLDIAATLSKPIRETQFHDVLVRVISGVDTAQPALKPSSAMGVTALKGRVLVVEDNAVNQRLASVQLGKLGLLADVAGDGAEALSALAQRPYDAVLMDCQMPGMDGYQTTRELRRRELVRGDGRRLPVIAMTANALEGDRERCLAVGMDDYVAKPVRIEALAETLERWLSRSVAPPPSSGPVEVPSPAVVRVPLSMPFAQVDIIDGSLLEQVRGEIADDEAFTQMLEMFIREIPERCAQIVEALRISDLRLVRTLAHKLRGSCQILGAKRLAHLCAAMEQAAFLQDQRTCQDAANAMPEVQAATLTALVARSH